MSILGRYLNRILLSRFAHHLAEGVDDFRSVSFSKRTGIEPQKATITPLRFEQDPMSDPFHHALGSLASSTGLPRFFSSASRSKVDIRWTSCRAASRPASVMR